MGSQGRIQTPHCNSVGQIKLPQCMWHSGPSWTQRVELHEVEVFSVCPDRTPRSDVATSGVSICFSRKGFPPISGSNDHFCFQMVWILSINPVSLPLDSSSNGLLSTASHPLYRVSLKTQEDLTLLISKDLWCHTLGTFVLMAPDVLSIAIYEAKEISQEFFSNQNILLFIIYCCLYNQMQRLKIIRGDLWWKCVRTARRRQRTVGLHFLVETWNSLNP